MLQDQRSRALQTPLEVDPRIQSLRDVFFHVHVHSLLFLLVLT